MLPTFVNSARTLTIVNALQIHYMTCEILYQQNIYNIKFYFVAIIDFHKVAIIDFHKNDIFFIRKVCYILTVEFAFIKIWVNITLAQNKGHAFLNRTPGMEQPRYLNSRSRGFLSPDFIRR